MFGLTFIKQKLDIMAGVINTIEGIVKSINTRTKTIIDLLFRIELIVNEIKRPDKSAFYFSKFKIENITIEGRLEKITMNEFQQVVGTFEALKKNGQPAKVQNPRVEVDHPEMATAEITGENEVTVKAIEGSIQEPTALLVTVFADADLGEGVREISVVGTIPLTPGEAESLAINFGEPTDVVTE